MHRPIAIKAGSKPAIIDAIAIAIAIADGRRPEGMSGDEEIVCEFSTELHRTRRVSDRSFARAEKRFGMQGLVDLTGVNACCTGLAMQLDMAQYGLPKDGKRLEQFPR